MMPLPSSAFPVGAALSLGVMLLLPQNASAASCPPARMPPSSEYLGLVTRFASDDPADAVSALGQWNEESLRCDLDNLQAAAVAARRCRGECADRLVFQRFPLRAAMLLHAQREIRDGFAAPVSEQLVRCRTGSQAQVVERLAGMLLLADPDPKPFLSLFYATMARRAHWSHCLPQAEEWARRGLKRLPGDGVLLLTLGTVLDTTATLTVVPSPRSAIQGSQAIRRFEAQTTRLNAMWTEVRRTLEQAVKADPDLHEAKLRLGRVLWRLDRPGPARELLEDVLSRSEDPALLYLAHLFRGRIHEDQNRLSDAESDYRAALALWPLSEAAPAALSHTRLLTGDLEGAREALESSLDRAPPGSPIDPFKGYLMVHTNEAQSVLDELRKGIAR